MSSSRKPKAKRHYGTYSVFEVEKNGVRQFCACKTISTSPRRFVRGYGSTPQEAELALRMRIKLRLNSPARTPATHKSLRTVRGYLEVWTDWNKGRISSESVRKYHNDIARHVLPYIGELKLSDLDEVVLRKLFEVSLANIGPSALWHTFTNLNAMLTHAVDSGILTRNPMKLVPHPRKLTAISADDDALSDLRLEVARELLDWISQPICEYYEFFPLVAFLFLGLRRAELLGLSPGDFHMEGDSYTLVVSKQLMRYEKDSENTGWYLKPETKTRKKRKISLFALWETATEVALDQREKITPVDDLAHHLLFLRKNGQAYTYNMLYKTWREVLTAFYNQGTPKEDWTTLEDWQYFRPHACRHIASSILFDAHVPASQAGLILGNSKSLQESIYQHLSARDSQATAESLQLGLSKRGESPILADFFASQNEPDWDT